MDNEIGSIQLGNLSVVTLLRLKTLFLQLASDARAAGDTGAEGFLTELSALCETARERNVAAMFRQDGPLN